jgi:hypothetical protein
MIEGVNPGTLVLELLGALLLGLPGGMIEGVKPGILLLELPGGMIGMMGVTSGALLLKLAGGIVWETPGTLLGIAPPEDCATELPTAVEVVAKPLESACELL